MAKRDDGHRKPRVRLLLLVLLWAWAACVFVIVDLFFNVGEFKALRPRSGLYHGMRVAAHKMVGERCEDAEESPGAWLAAARPRTPPLPSWAVLIEGVVYSPEGRPAVGANVAARDRLTGAAVSATAGDGGAYRLEVLAGRTYDLAASAQNCGAAILRGVVAPSEANLALTDCARISGRALDDAGRGVEGVVLQLIVRTGIRQFADDAFAGPGLSKLATTDREGEYVLEPVPLAEGCAFALKVADGPVRVGQSVAIDVSAGPEIHCDVHVERTDKIALSGILRDAATGAPIPDGLIVFAPGCVARSAADGSFHQENVPQGELTLVVRVDGRPRSLHRILVSEQTQALDVRVPPGRAVVGRVIDADGRPVPEASVQWTGPSAHGEATTTDGEGRFRIEQIAADDRGAVRVQAPGMVTAEARPEHDGTELVLRLHRGSQVSGRVVLPSSASDQLGVTILSKPVEPTPLTPEGRPTAPTGVDVQRVHVTRADAAGWYTLDSLPAGVRLLVAIPDDRGFAPVEREVTVPVAGSVILPDLLVHPSPRIEGHVVDTQGGPVAGAVVQIRSAANPASAITDENGWFLLEGLPSSEQELQVSRPGYQSARAAYDPRTPGPLCVPLAALRGGPDARDNR